jgi:hypothetical protein
VATAALLAEHHEIADLITAVTVHHRPRPRPEERLGDEELPLPNEDGDARRRAGVSVSVPARAQDRTFAAATRSATSS